MERATPFYGLTQSEVVKIQNHYVFLFTEEDVSTYDCEGACEFYPTCEKEREACLKSAFAKLMATLAPKEATVLALCFGYYQQKLYTMAEIAALLDITPEEVRRITAKAIRKLRHPARRGVILEKADAYTSATVPFYKNLTQEVFGEELV